LTDLVRGAIAIACDNRPALRTINTDFSRVSNEAAFSCGGGLTWDEAFISLFADTGGGDIGFMLGTLNADTSDVGVNLISCGNDIDYDSLLMSLIGVAHLEGGDCNFLRTHAVYLQPDCGPIACGTFQSFLDLFRQAIVITDDGLPALRVFYYVDNCNDYSPFSCASGVTQDEALNEIFWIVGGEIAIAAMCVTDQN